MPHELLTHSSANYLHSVESLGLGCGKTFKTGMQKHDQKHQFSYHASSLTGAALESGSAASSHRFTGRWQERGQEASVTYICKMPPTGRDAAPDREIVCHIPIKGQSHLTLGRKQINRPYSHFTFHTLKCHIFPF